MNSEERFAKLREYLEKPSKQNWSDLLALLEEWKGSQGFDEAVDVAEEHLQLWPDDLRTFPGSPKDFLSMEAKSYLGRLIATLDLKGKELEGVYLEYELFYSPHLQNLTTLNLCNNWIFHVYELANSPHIQTLQRSTFQTIR